MIWIVSFNLSSHRVEIVGPVMKIPDNTAFLAAYNKDIERYTPEEGAWLG
jgi:hypothetical protein